MRLRKMAAGILAAAMAVVSLPQAVNAEGSEPEFGVGDIFYVAFDPNTGAVVDGKMYSDDSNSSAYLYNAAYRCKILNDETISVETSCMVASPYIHYRKKIAIPSTIAGYTVTQFGLGIANEWSGHFYSITFPDTVTIINQSAFASHIYLEEINFGANSQLKLIDKWAFQDCRSLKSITIPASVETIAQGAFVNTDESFLDNANVYSLETVNFAAGSKLKLIDQWAFQNQYSLKSITLPDSLEKIGYGAFIECTSLAKIDIPKNVNEIGAFAFSPTKIAAINVDENNKSFKSIDGVLFSKDGKTIVAYPCDKSGDYAIPTDVNKIAEAAFGYSAKLTSVSIPEGVTAIPENAFTYCTSLAEVTLPSTLKSIAKWGFEATAFTSLYIPASVTSIDPHAFDSAALKTINGVEGSYAETYAKQNGYAFNGMPGETNPDVPDDSSTFTDGSGDTGIEVIDNNGAIPKEAVFSVRVDDEHSSDTRIAYDCSFTYNGAEYEPTETVTVRIPVPIAMRDIADTLKVYHLQDGKYVPMTVKYEDGYLVFETDHFSIYVVTPDTISEDGDDDTTTTEPTPAIPTIPSGSFQVPETTTAAATTTEAAPAATETADNSTANTSAAAVATTTTTTAAPAVPADTNGSSGDTAQPVVSEDNGSDNSTADNGAADVGNDGAANDKGENPDTGSAIAIVPMIVAAAAVSFIAYKRKK